MTRYLIAVLIMILFSYGCSVSDDDVLEDSIIKDSSVTASPTLPQNSSTTEKNIVENNDINTQKEQFNSDDDDTTNPDTPKDKPDEAMPTKTYVQRDTNFRDDEVDSDQSLQEGGNPLPDPRAG